MSSTIAEDGNGNIRANIQVSDSAHEILLNFNHRVVQNECVGKIVTIQEAKEKLKGSVVSNIVSNVID